MGERHNVGRLSTGERKELSRNHREDFYFVDRFHGDRGAACPEVHTNFAEKSACLTAHNVRNGVRSYNSQITGGVANAAPLHIDVFRN
jgi:hypothetical protein